MTTGSDLTGRRLRVHVNLHRGDFSIVVPGTGRVIGHAADVTMTGVTFRVRPGGLRRIREQGHREVCAYAIGTVTAADTGPDVAGMARITFNPYRADTFTCDGQPVTQAAEVVFAGRAGWSRQMTAANGPGAGNAQNPGAGSQERTTQP